MKRVYDAKFFEGKCPYTDKPCYEWECDTCEVEAQEKKDMEELNKADKAESEELSDRNLKMWEEIFKAERENNK